MITDPLFEDLHQPCYTDLEDYLDLALDSTRETVSEVELVGVCTKSAASSPPRSWPTATSRYVLTPWAWSASTAPPTKSVLGVEVCPD